MFRRWRRPGYRKAKRSVAFHRPSYVLGLSTGTAQAERLTGWAVQGRRVDDVLKVSEAIERYGLGVMRNNVDRGRWQKPCRGVVVLHNGEVSQKQLLAVALASAARGAVLGGLSALTCEKFEGFSAPQPQIVLPSGARPPRWRDSRCTGAPSSMNGTSTPCARPDAPARHEAWSTRPAGRRTRVMPGPSSSPACNRASPRRASCGRPSHGEAPADTAR
jgi:hypothetical protein